MTVVILKKFFISSERHGVRLACKDQGGVPMGIAYAFQPKGQENSSGLQSAETFMLL
jgi:hypothetical protein